MTPWFRLGWPDYVLIALTCGLVLLVIEYWNPHIEDWLRSVTAPVRNGQGTIPPGERP